MYLCLRSDTYNVSSTFFDIFLAFQIVKKHDLARKLSNLSWKGVFHQVFRIKQTISKFQPFLSFGHAEMYPDHLSFQMGDHLVQNSSPNFRYAFKILDNVSFTFADRSLTITKLLESFQIQARKQFFRQNFKFKFVPTSMLKILDDVSFTFVDHFSRVSDHQQSRNCQKAFTFVLESTFFVKFLNLNFPTASSAHFVFRYAEMRL